MTYYSNPHESKWRDHYARQYGGVGSSWREANRDPYAGSRAGAQDRAELLRIAAAMAPGAGTALGGLAGAGLGGIIGGIAGGAGGAVIGLPAGGVGAVPTGATGATLGALSGAAIGAPLGATLGGAAGTMAAGGLGAMSDRETSRYDREALEREARRQSMLQLLALAR